MKRMNADWMGVCWGNGIVGEVMRWLTFQGCIRKSKPLRRSATMKFAALDVHKSFSQVCILDKKSGVLDNFRIESSREAVRGLGPLLSDVKGVALEASSHWGWIVDELQGMGVDVTLSHPSKTKAIGSAKIKTDKIDANMLAYLLSADLLPEAHIPSFAVRERRSYLRHRYAVVCMRTQCKNRVHAILAGYGLRCPYEDAFCQGGIEWRVHAKFMKRNKCSA
jgi:transposase